MLSESYFRYRLFIVMLFGFLC